MLRNARSIPFRAAARFLSPLSATAGVPAACSVGPFKLAIPDKAKFHSTTNFCASGTKNPLIKEIDDLGKSNKSADDVLRCKLASVYRLVDLKGWSWSIYNHITVRSTENPDHFFINPYGLFYEEITASSLLKIDSACNVIDSGSTSYGVNRAGFTLHSTIHDARKDINAVLHVHTGVAAGLSALKTGFLPISQEALLCGRVSYHDYEGILVDEPMRARIRQDLGPKNKIMVLRNHGVVFCGNTIEEAWFWLITFMTACDIQFHAMAAAGGKDNLIIPPERVLLQVQKILEIGVNEKPRDGVQWALGEMELEAEMRRLDKLGYKSGYAYKKTN